MRHLPTGYRRAKVLRAHRRSCAAFTGYAKRNTPHLIAALVAFLLLMLGSGLDYPQTRITRPAVADNR